MRVSRVWVVRAAELEKLGRRASWTVDLIGEGALALQKKSPRCHKGHEGYEGHEGHEKKSSRCKNKTKQNKEKDDGLFMVCVH